MTRGELGDVRPGYRSRPAVPNGPRDYRVRIRRRGPLAAMVPAALLAGVGQALLLGSPGIGRAVAGMACTVLAAPFVLVLGAPFTSSPLTVLLAVALSAALWVGIGTAAAARATRRPAVAWREYWHEFAWSGAAVWTGIAGGLAAVDIALGRPLL